MNKVLITGRLTADVNVKYSRQKMAMTNFCLAVDGGKAKSGEQLTEFINIVAFDKLAEFVANYFEKGKRYLVDGYLHREDYTNKEGITYPNYKVIAQRLEFADGK